MISLTINGAELEAKPLSKEKGYITDIGNKGHKNVILAKVETDKTEILFPPFGLMYLSGAVEKAGFKAEIWHGKKKELKDLGVSGIGVYSGHHSEEENSMFKSLADELGMLITGGSDFHGDSKPNIKLGVFGEDVQIDLDVLVKKMKELLAMGSPL